MDTIDSKYLLQDNVDLKEKLTFLVHMNYIKNEILSIKHQTQALKIVTNSLQHLLLTHYGILVNQIP